ncbi:MAG: AAA family ATPase [bacterium]
MRFHRVMLRDYKGIRHCVFEPRENGVTIIEGENEAGKSSIAEALWLIFEQNDDSSSQLVKGLRPADRDAATEIEVEVSSGPYRFTYFKRFHRGPRTELTITAPRREVLVGREAFNRARQILDETIDLALWKALRSQQGVQESLDPPTPGQHRSLLGALDEAAGSLMGGDREQSLFAAANAEYERYFTASGKEKSAGEGPSLPKLRAAEVVARSDSERIQARIALIDEKSQRAAELEALLRELGARVETFEPRRGALAASEQRRLAAHSEVARVQAQFAAAEASARELISEQDARQRILAAMAPRQETLATLAVDAASLEPKLSEARSLVESARAEHDATQSRRLAAETAVRQSEDLVQLSARQLQIDQMEERLGRLERLEPQVAELNAWLGACKVDARLVQEIEDVDKKLAVLDARREAEAAAVEITAADESVITVNGQEITLSPGQTRRGKVRGETALEFPGGLTVNIRAGSAAREIEEQARVAKRSLDARLGSAGVESLEDARKIFNERTANEERSKQFASQIQNDLRDLASARELGEKLHRERDAVRLVLEESLLATPPTVDEAKARREQAIATARSIDEQLRLASEALNAATSALRDLERQVEIFNARAEALKEELERNERDLEAQRNRLADDDLSAAMNEAQSTRDAARETLDLAESEFASLTDASEALQEVELELDGLTRAMTSARMEESGIRALLEDAGADGLHGQLVEAEQRLTAASEDLASFSRRAAAARLLFETLKARRDEARESYAGPLQECIERLGRRIYNDTFSVELSDDLRIVGRSLDGITLDIGQISVGAREQLSVLTRLACAALVSRDGGAPLVLDDIFGWADPRRLDALGPVLAEAAKDIQVLLFTCSPQRFATVRPARVVTMPTGKWSDRSVEGEVATPVVEGTPEKPAARRSPLATPTVPGARAPQGAFDLFEAAATAGERLN